MSHLASLVLSSLTPVILFGQVSFQSVSLEASLVSSQTLFRVTLLNSGAATMISLAGDLQRGQGEPVLAFTTEPFKLASGMQTIASAELLFQSFSYSSTNAGRAAQRFHQLPGGEYRYCIRLKAPQAESADEYCDLLSVEEMLFLDLVHPWNGDSIDEVRPALTWMLSGSPAAMGNTQARLVLSPMGSGMDAAQALSAEQPLFMLPHVQERTVPYPAGIADLERGRCYAWQVELMDGSRITDRSEPWSFCVKRQEVPFQNKYVRLDKLQPGAVYEALDRKIFFRYDEPYASAQLDCAIYGRDHVRIVPAVVDDANAEGDEGIRSVGVNLYELDLQPYGLKTGYYDLVVKNEKGRDLTMKFHVTP